MKRYFDVEQRSFAWGDMYVVVLGEQGRGRKEVYIPYHAHIDCQLVELGSTKSGHVKIVASQSNVGWLAVVSGRGVYTRGTYGTVYVPPAFVEKVKVVAYGYGAYGDAGRIGSWYEFLITVEDNTFLKIRPAGGSSKKARYWLYFDADVVRKISMEEMPLFCDAFGIPSPPEEFDALVDLKELINNKGGNQ